MIFPNALPAPARDAPGAASARPGTGPVLHLVTNLEAANGAETMLARLLRAWPGGERAEVLSLMKVSPRLSAMIGESAASCEALGAASAGGMAAGTLRLAALLRRRRPRALVCWMYHAMAAGALAARMSGTGAPVYWTVRQSLEDMEAFPPRLRATVALCRRLAPLATGIVYNSERARDQHERYGFAASRAAVIPNGFEPPDEIRVSPRRARLFGMAARLHPQKDHATFLAAAARVAARLPDARFALAGRGLEPGAEAPLRAAAAAGLPPERLSLRGEIEDMNDFYREIDVLVLSSRTEGFPNVVAEAMGQGRPVVTTNVGAAAEIVGNTGVIAPPRDPEALAAGMLEMAALSPQAWAARAMAAHRRVAARYPLESAAERFRAFVETGE